MNNKFFPLVFAATLVLTGCIDEKTPTTDGSNGAATSSLSKDDAIAVVNGKYISKTALAQLETEISQRSRGQDFPKDKLIDELVHRELLIQEATNKQLDKTEEFNEQLATIRSSLLSQAAIQNYLKINPVTDADLEAEYNKNVAASGTEYKARHILVEKEETAKQLIAELSKGADFTELAKTKSTGPSAPTGGDLGWFSEGQMVAPFSQAVAALEDNKFTTAPVQTQFGWHIILREGSRSQTPPPFESVKAQMQPMLQRKKIQDYMETLRSQANVEILLPVKDEAASTAPAAVPPTPASTDNVPADQASDTAEPLSEKAEDSVEAEKSTTEEVINSVTEAAEKVKEAVTP